MLPANAPVLKALVVPTRLGITCAWACGIDIAIGNLRRALAAGLRLVQIREQRLEPAARKEFAAGVTQAVSEVGGLVMINSDIQLAGTLGAGLHLPSSALMSTPSRPAVQWCSASCHNLAELDKAAELGLDFVLLGPVESTPSHADAKALGWSSFAHMVRNYPLPVFALGGLRTEDLHTARLAGAHGVAMMRGAWTDAAS